MSPFLALNLCSFFLTSSTIVPLICMYSSSICLLELFTRSTLTALSFSVFLSDYYAFSSLLCLATFYLGERQWLLLRRALVSIYFMFLRYLSLIIALFLPYWMALWYRGTSSDLFSFDLIISEVRGFSLGSII
jgi:hypothetical protein